MRIYDEHFQEVKVVQTPPETIKRLYDEWIDWDVQCEIAETKKSVILKINSLIFID